MGRTTICVVHDDRARVDAADGENRDLRLTDDRQAEQTAENAGIRDRERAALHVFRSQLLRARAARQIMNRAAESGEIETFRAVNHGHDQPLIERHGDAEIDRIAIDDVVAVERRVGERELAESRPRWPWRRTRCR